MQKPNALDNDLIISALEGDFRTQTKQSERGTGLPTLFQATELSQVALLNIISNNAYITIKNKSVSKKRTLTKKFHGTLIAWDLIKNKGT